VLRRYTYDYEYRDGRRERQHREVYVRGDAAVVLPYDAARGTVLLTRQLRLPAFLHGDTEPLIEACAGVIEDASAANCALREAREELGYVLSDLKLAFRGYSSPGCLQECIYGFIAAYTPEAQLDSGGGAADEGEDIEVLELSLDEAFAMIAKGEIIDAKTIALLQHLKLQQV
jgi:nudix-type nucleoside diphosphatase (YffH/AdpP family)